MENGYLFQKCVAIAANFFGLHDNIHININFSKIKRSWPGFATLTDHMQIHDTVRKT